MFRTLTRPSTSSAIPVDTPYTLSPEAIAQIVQIVEAVVNKNIIKSGSSDNQKWRTDDIRFFDLYLDFLYKVEDVIYIGKDIYYRSANIFCERVIDLSKSKSVKLIRNDLSIYLRGTVLQ